MKSTFPIKACALGLVIAVSGLPGSGKSTLAKRLAEAYGLRYISSGMLFRKMAKERGMTLEEFTKYAERKHSIDRSIDQNALNEAKKGCVVLDGHIAAWIADKYAHLKIYLNASKTTRAKRISLRDSITYEKALKEVNLRDESETKRFREIYGIDVRDLSIFDLVISSEKFSAESVFKIVSVAVDLLIGDLLRKSLKTDP